MPSQARDKHDNKPKTEEGGTCAQGVRGERKYLGAAMTGAAELWSRRDVDAVIGRGLWLLPGLPSAAGAGAGDTGAAGGGESVGGSWAEYLNPAAAPAGNMCVLSYPSGTQVRIQ